MKIHSDIISEGDIHLATRAAGMRGVQADVSRHGSRSRQRSFTVHLTGNSPRRTNSGHYGVSDEHAATWDEWGMFIQALYLVDPNALIGQYGDYNTFAFTTCGRFQYLTAPYACRPAGHKWIPQGDYIHECKWCSARQDFTRMWAIQDAKRAARA